MWLDPRPADLFQRGMRCDRHATLISHIESREEHIQVSLSPIPQPVRSSLPAELI